MQLCCFATNDSFRDVPHFCSQFIKIHKTGNNVTFLIKNTKCEHAGLINKVCKKFARVYLQFVSVLFSHQQKKVSKFESKIHEEVKRLEFRFRLSFKTVTGNDYIRKKIHNIHFSSSMLKKKNETRLFLLVMSSVNHRRMLLKKCVNCFVIRTSLLFLPKE